MLLREEAAEGGTFRRNEPELSLLSEDEEANKLSRSEDPLKKAFC